jgi:hypothetical protein
MTSRRPRPGLYALVLFRGGGSGSDAPRDVANPGRGLELTGRYNERQCTLLDLISISRASKLAC